jgi:glycosyltransferase involved in cell wall biosynthesis
LKPTLDTYPVKKYKNRQSSDFSPSWIPFSNAVKKINALNPDIVHLHWVCESFIRPEDLSKIKAPVVWTMHDMWPFTGGCHYAGTCTKYKSGCQNCPLLNSGRDKDLSYRLYARKKVAFDKVQNLTLVGSSKWMADCARESSLSRGKNVVSLPNPIDTERYKPIGKEVAKNSLNLSLDKKIVLFCESKNPRKGYQYLSEALKNVNTREIELLTFGGLVPGLKETTEFKMHRMGEVSDDITLQILYNAADVVVVPSLEENLSNIIMESLSCGTPVVAFDIGGNSDMIDHRLNGYLAKEMDANDLAAGIDWVISNTKDNNLGTNARNKVLSTFDSKVVVKQYIALYQSLLIDPGFNPGV